MSLTLDRLDVQADLTARALELMPSPTVILDGEMRLRFANAAARERLEPPPPEEDPLPSFDQVLGRSGRVSSDVRLRILSCCAAALRGRQGTGRHDAIIAVEPGLMIAFHARHLEGERWMVVLEDRTASLDPNAILDEAQRDVLTGLGNGLYLAERSKEMLAQTDQEDRPALLLLDVDRFREVNESLGRQGGDALLRAIAGRLKRATRDADRLARLDADQFAVLQTNGLGADHLAARLVEILSRPYLIRGEIATIGVSAGIARAASRDTPETLLHNAGLARREAKQAGGNAWRRFGQSLAERARSRQDLEADLRKALALDQLSLVYQPRMNVRTHAITGFEALARWTHPVRGAVPPSLFIPVAEEIGVIRSIGVWALRTACHDAAAWPEPVSVSVNVSFRQLEEGRAFVTEVVEALRSSGLPARRLELELTETALIRRPDDVRALLGELHGLGVRLAMDDFGAGDMAVRQIRTFPFDSIRIDQSFIRTLDSGADSGAVVRAIATLGAGLGMSVVAEGVETRHQALIVRGDGCTDIQGYLISRPVPVTEVPGLLTRDLSKTFVG